MAMLRMDKFSWTWKFFRELFANWQLLASGLSMGAASLLWFWIIKNHPLSIAYPLISISYIFGAIAALLIFHESIPPTRWIGIIFIMIGVAFLAK